ncbi:MAG: DUF456 domain-containing protein [Leptolyngbyaceae cyanobacterium]
MLQLSLVSALQFSHWLMNQAATATGATLSDRLSQGLTNVRNMGATSLTTVQTWTQQLAQTVAQAIQSFWIHINQLFDVSTQQIQALSHTVTTVVVTSALWQVGLYWVLLLLMLVGFIGSFVPILPGVALVLLAVIIWGAVTGLGGIGWSLGVAIAAFLLSITVDNLAGFIGAQKAGASRWGQIGALVGMAIGFLVLTSTIPVVGPVLGIILGTMLGAIVGEFLHRRDLELQPRTRQSFKVGLAILVGSLVGNLLQGVLALIAIGVFLWETWSTVYG